MLLALRTGGTEQRLSINLRAARLHVLADLGGSVAAIAADIIVALTGWERADALLSLLIVALIGVTALRLLNETLAVLMERSPAGVDLRGVEESLATLPSVRLAHDLHCWTIAGDFVSFACHLELEPDTEPLATIEAATSLLRDRYGLLHVTIQPEGPAATHVRAAAGGSGSAPPASR